MQKPSTSELTPEQRMAQVAAILARGVLRCKQAARGCEPPPANEVLESSQDCLELGENPRLSVSQRHGF